MSLSGTNFVRFSRHGLQSIRSYWPNMADRFEVRRQGLKLRFWDERHLHGTGMLFDHSYEKIKALASESIYELRLDDDIGGQSNIRIVLFDPPSTWKTVEDNVRPFRVIWILEALPKKRNEWTKNDITRFKGQRLLLKKRFYEPA